MALIECEKCKRKISDTSSKCIHCGSPIQASITVASETDFFDCEMALGSSLNDMTKNTCNEANTAKKEFGEFTQNEKDRLEEEFRNADTWAKRYFRQKTEFAKFRRPLYWFILSLALLISILNTFVGKKFQLIEYLVPRLDILTISLLSLVALFVVCVVMFIYGIIGPIYFGITHKKYIYSKRFMLWLAKEKNVMYSPPLLLKREKKIFDRIYVE